MEGNWEIERIIKRNECQCISIALHISSCATESQLSGSTCSQRVRPPICQSATPLRSDRSPTNAIVGGPSPGTPGLCVNITASERSLCLTDTT
ncbi:hypothetical protein MHYP_G00261580 [Metynnis hypsauchen]